MRTFTSQDPRVLSGAMKAMGDPLRLRILQLLPSGPDDARARCNVNELAAAVGSPQPTVSHHLKILKHMGLIRFNRQRNNVHYYRDTAAVAQLLRDVGSLLKVPGRP